MLIKLNSVKLDNTVIDNRLKKFYVREANPIKNFAYLANKVPNAANIKKPQHLANNKDKSAENNNQNNINNEVNKSINKSFKSEININKSQNNIKKKKFIRIFILIKI